MNIFYMGYSLKVSSGGIENYTATVLKYLQQIGHKVVVYTIKDKNESFENIEIKRNKYLDKFFLGRRVKKRLLQMCADVDVFLCGHLFLAMQMEVIAKQYGKKYHLFVYGIDCWAGRFESKCPKLNNLDKVVSISTFTSRQIRRQGFQGEIVYVPPVITERKYTEMNQRPHGSEVTFLTVGRLSSEERYKGHDKVIEAMGILVHRHKVKNVVYWIVGKGDDRIRLEEKVRDLMLEEHVVFHGFVSDEELPDKYLKSDVYIMPSNVSLDPKKPEGEGFGIVFIEAAMYELPLIGPSVGGSTDIIDDKINGLECNPLSAEDISEKMRYLILRKEKRIEYGKNAKKKVLQKYTVAQLGEYLEGVVD